MQALHSRLLSSTDTLHAISSSASLIAGKRIDLLDAIVRVLDHHLGVALGVDLPQHVLLQVHQLIEIVIQSLAPL